MNLPKYVAEGRKRHFFGSTTNINVLLGGEGDDNLMGGQLTDHIHGEAGIDGMRGLGG